MSKLLRVLVVVLVLQAGFTARVAYEEFGNPATLTLAYAQDDDPCTGRHCNDYRSQAEAQSSIETRSF